MTELVRFAVFMAACVVLERQYQRRRLDLPLVYELTRGWLRWFTYGRRVQISP